MPVIMQAILSLVPVMLMVMAVTIF